MASLTVDKVTKVFDDGSHNAFTDLTRFKGDMYLAFRTCPQGHMMFSSSRITVMRSSDGKAWTRAHSFGVKDRDVRDPHFLVFQDTLFVYTGAWLTPEGGSPVRDMNEMQGYCAWTADGSSWNGPRYLVGTQSHYIWRAAAHGGQAYLCGRRKRFFAPPSEKDDSQASLEGALLRSPDGFHFEAVGFFRETYGNETAFQFEADGSVTAIARGVNNTDVPALVCRSKPPYRAWTRASLGRNIGGPLLAKWGDRWLVGGRNNLTEGKPFTALYWLEGDALVEAASLPSGGDNSYPGFLELSPTMGLVSFYSSHEGSGTSLAPCSIYLAEVSCR